MSKAGGDAHLRGALSSTLIMWTLPRQTWALYIPRKGKFHIMLRYISEPQLRADITAGTNKVESYNRFVKWLVFGNEATISDLDPEEAEKAIKYGSVLANAVILHNAYDLTEAIKQLIEEGHAILAEDLEFLSPYMTGHIKRFGDYVITEEAEPPSVESAILWTLPPRRHQERVAAGTHRASTGP